MDQKQKCVCTVSSYCRCRTTEGTTAQWASMTHTLMHMHTHTHKIGRAETFVSPSVSRKLQQQSGAAGLSSESGWNAACRLHVQALKSFTDHLIRVLTSLTVCERGHNENLSMASKDAIKERICAKHQDHNRQICACSDVLIKNPDTNQLLTLSMLC